MNKRGLVVALIGGVAFCAHTAQAAYLLQIIKAVYGEEYAGKTCDGTGVIARACNGRQRCVFKSDDRICGDPSPNQPKTLRVTYKCAHLGPYDAIFESNAQKEVFLACY